MSAATVDGLHDRLVSHIVQDDRRQARGRRHNPNALGIMLRAAQEAREEAVRDGGTVAAWVRAVCRNFTATRPMHTFLKKVDSGVEVVHGEWVVGERVVR